MKYLVLCVIINIVYFIHRANSTVQISAKFDDDSTKTVNFMPKTSFQLVCNVSSPSSTDITVTWEKDDVPIKDIKKLISRTKQINNGLTYTLKIFSAIEEDSGNFTCNVVKDGHKISSARIFVISKIAVKVVTNVNVVEGETLRIQCNVFGKPYPKLHWFYYNDTYNETFTESKGRIILDEDHDRHIPNSILKIEKVDMNDRGNYKCLGKQDISDEEVSATCMVRIKDKYAALWPFLGICAEVFILCAIIFIYEKKRNKTELEESDTDQSPDQKTSDNNKDSNLRHRQ